MTLAGRVGPGVNKRAAMLLETVGLAERMDRKPAQLSGGEQQRVAIAVALANEPALLLADEPTGELDASTSDQVYELFQTLNQEFGLTIIAVSHDPMISRHVGRVVAIRDGKTAAETVRRRRDKAAVEHHAELSHEDEFEELIVLDSAGRLQIPKAYREQLEIQGHVRMEVTEDGLIIRPAENPSQ